MQFVATAVDPMPSAAYRNPLREHLLPALTAGRVAVNDQAIDDSAGEHRVHAQGSHEATWASFNAGELLAGPERPASVLPILLWIAGGSAYLLWRAPERAASG
jgi:hypothetical protein